MKTFKTLSLAVITFLCVGAGAQQLFAPVRIVGIGAILQQLSDGTIQVTGLIPSAPAVKAGIAVGDEILEVKSLPGSSLVAVRSLPLADVVALIRGPVGVPVELLIQRGGSEILERFIIREEFEIEDGE